MYPVSCANNHHDVADLVNHGMVKMQNLNILRTENSFSMKQKKNLTCASDGTFWEVIVL